MSVIPVQLAVEDDLSEMVVRRLLKHSGRGYEAGIVYGHGGYGYLRKTIAGWNRAARGIPMLVLTDLDQYPCPPALIADWIPAHRHHNLVLRVAVREVESWLLADAENLSRFLRVRPKLIPPRPDSLPDPKATLVHAARHARSREIRYRLAPKPGSTAKQGPDYNACLAEFVRVSWDVEKAAGASPSLARTVARLRSFEPVWPTR